MDLLRKEEAMPVYNHLNRLSCMTCHVCVSIVSSHTVTIMSCCGALRAAKQMDTLTKEVAVPLGTYMKGFPPVQRLHPFEQAMLDLTWGTQTYERVLSKVDSLRKSVLQASYA